ncbi:MAG TPA: HlyD family secretion protein, partial [Candidatus Angelobacter sp.]
MANPVKASPTYEEEVRQPQPVREEEERQPEPEHPSLRERRAGFFREHPRAQWVIIAVVLLLVAGGMFVWHYYSVRESTDDAQVDGHINPISARVSGTAVHVYYDDNQQVKAGDLLVELDPRDYEVAVQRAKAELANAVANAAAAGVDIPLTTTTSSNQLVAANAAVNSADHEVITAQARVQEAQANYTKAAADLKRMEQLVQKDEISRQQYDAAVAAAAATKASLEAANSAVANAQARAAQARAQASAAGTVPEQIKMTRAKAGAALAEVERDRAALAQAELNLQYTKVRAPVNGIVSKRSVEPGQVVQAGQPLFAIVDLDNLWITANFKETQLQYMRPGQNAEVSVDAFGHTYQATVESIGGATGSRFSLLPPENATGNYVKVVQRIPVRIRINKGEDPGHQ